jgi:hypothetical protein
MLALPDRPPNANGFFAEISRAGATPREMVYEMTTSGSISI